MVRNRNIAVSRDWPVSLITRHQKVSPTHRMVRATWEDSGAGGSLAESRDG
jgi:hypothetical protein